MTARKGYMIGILIVLVLAAGAAAHVLYNRVPTIEKYTDAGRLPRISPDYVGVVLPPNIAPLNFLIRERGRRYLVRISSDSGSAIQLHGYSPEMIIPPRQVAKASGGQPRKPPGRGRLRAVRRPPVDPL